MNPAKREMARWAHLAFHQLPSRAMVGVAESLGGGVLLRLTLAGVCELLGSFSLPAKLG